LFGALLVLTMTSGCTGAPPSALDSASVTPVVSPTLTPRELRRQPEVTIPFSEQNWARGLRRYLYVAVIPHPSDVCRNYGFRSKMTMLVAYQTDCPSLSGTRRDDLFFYVAVRNVTDAPATFELRNFSLESQDGRSFRPVAVGPSSPSDFLPEAARMPARSNVFGYVTFSADAAHVVPANLNYEDGTQTLTVMFDGEPARATP
jgi:hypothetical protein